MKQNTSLAFLQEKGFCPFHVNKGFEETFFWRADSLFHLMFVDASFLQNLEALFTNVISSRW